MVKGVRFLCFSMFHKLFGGVRGLLEQLIRAKECGFLTMWFCRDKIREYRDESERLDQCTRLYDSSISNVNFELDASRIAQVRIFHHGLCILKIFLSM